MSLRPIFHDPSGRRGRIARALVASALGIAGVTAGSLALGILRPPVMVPLPVRGVEVVASPNDDAVRRDPCAPATPRCPALARPQHVGTDVADPIVAAFAVQWDEGSRAALRRVGDHLDWVIVEGAFLGRGTPGAVTVTLDRDLLDDARRHETGVHLMITNFRATGFDSLLVQEVVQRPERRRAAIDSLVATVERHGLQGITVDFERVPASTHPQVLAFMTELRAALVPFGAVLSVAIPVPDDGGYPIAQYAAASDYVIPMLYDEHAAATEPGPVASARWFAERIDRVMAEVPAHQLLMGLGQYGYHWRSDKPQGATVSVSEAMALGRAAPTGMRFDAATRTPRIAWRDAAGVRHDVWYLDAATAWNQLRLSLGSGAAGVAFWRLGGEDATLWRILGRHGMTGSADSLRALPNNGVAVLSGDGEVLAVEGSEGTGERALVLDADGFVASEAIVRAPGGYVVSRAGTTGRRVALTFDDGPDPDYTASILDTLASRRAVASFFVVGKQVQRLPELARRIADEGHEIGNHSWSHADLSTLSESSIRMELAATGRVIEAVTGHRPLLFRPPYIGDASPATEERLRPMAIANTLGYRIAALAVDPKDWFERDPADIVANAMRAVREGEGRIILLHDAGGDRSPTVAALGPLVDSLRAAGYTLTTVAGLLDVTPDAGTLVAPADEAPQRVLNAAAVEGLNLAQRLLAATFLVALVLGLVRLAGITILATLQRTWRRYARRRADLQYEPDVSVIIPAYNEGRVIARTIRSALAQDYAHFEVLIVDDGSTDDTSARAVAASDDPRLRVLRQDNAGKAAALNTGIAQARGAVIVVIDADTVLAPDALWHLVRPLADARVGAVAGNAKVGNRVNLVTRWQAVEYVTSQNLDRRAFATLNCITVVPGAIGAWRRSAVLDAGGFRTDTLAEDQDLTLTLLRAGHRVALAEDAIALTEAPERLGALLRQRFRWSFGTLQCAWKHRGALFNPRAGALGMVGLPNVVLFQLLFPLLAPAADVALVASMVRLAIEAQSRGVHAAWAHALPVLSLYAFFLVIDTVTALLGVAFERGERFSQALLVPLQRVAYRQVLYVALLKAMYAAVKGWAPGWGKLERTGRVQELAPHAHTRGAA